MKKSLLLFTTILLFFLSGNSQNIDNATLNKLKTKLFAIENLYDDGQYREVLKKADEIEELMGEGFQSPSTQNYRVKANIKLKRFENAQEELNSLYSMNPNDNILKDIAAYEYLIENGIEEEKRRKEKQRLAEEKRKEKERLAEIERKKQKEKERLAAIEREKERQKLYAILDDFEYQTCPTCEGSGKEYYSKKVKCKYRVPTKGKSYYVTNCNGTGYHIKRYKSSGGYLTGQEKKFTCQGCNGTGKQDNKSNWNCRTCKGLKESMFYYGSQKFSEKELTDIYTKNKSEIHRIINEKERKAALTYKDRALSDTIFLSIRWKETPRRNATYYRITERKSNGLYLIKNYYSATGKLQMKAFSNKLPHDSKSTFVGECVWYRDNEMITNESYYDNGVKKQSLRYNDYGKVEVIFYNKEGSKIYDSQYGIIKEINFFPNGMIKYLKWEYVSSSNSKYSKYRSFICDEQGNLLTENILNKKGKIKETKKHN